MSPDEIERRLANLPIALPEPHRERVLLAALRGAELSAQSQRAAHRLAWWRRPIPLWQAAALVAAMILIDVAWVRPARPAPRAEPRVAVRIDRDIFGRQRPAGEPFDVSRWETRVSTGQ